ncbi:hypothetical protein [uncultured Alistipes sp.]|uniref:hypothetical protein n=1 Tax=uncultured Alistipes sp. TaxID=538949 RepID=UPI0025F2753E|nr:hypothetical protein [uncultured Alistipes sp.]
MKTKKAAVAAPVCVCKDTQNWPIIKRSLPLDQRKAVALKLLKEGRRATAVTLNRAIGFNDARKWVATLRRTLLDYEVHSVRLRDRRVVYRLEKIAADRNLFSGQEDARHE